MRRCRSTRLITLRFSPMTMARSWLRISATIRRTSQSSGTGKSRWRRLRSRRTAFGSCPRTRMLVANLGLAAFDLSIPLGHDVQSGLRSAGELGESCQELGAVGGDLPFNLGEA